MLVLLRVSIGWHFLYEGVWKINHADKFSAQPFLTQAKGPFAPLFYEMIPDLDGRQRLTLTETDDLMVTSQIYLDAWTEVRDAFVDTYEPGPDQLKQSDKAFAAYEASLEEYLTANSADIESHFAALDRFEKAKAAGNNGASFQKERAWDDQQKLRSEVKGWLSELDKMGEGYQAALWDILDEDQRQVGMVPAPVPETDKMPVVGSRSNALDLAVTYGLTAIGLCLLLGLFTRLACLGGGMFLISVLLTQPPWPGIYPPAPEVVGHSMIVDKNFVEMIAIFLLAATPVGRFGGLDFFIHTWLTRPFFSRRRAKTD